MVMYLIKEQQEEVPTQTRGVYESYSIRLPHINNSLSVEQEDYKEVLKNKIKVRHQEDLDLYYNTELNLSLFQKKYNLIPKQEIYQSHNNHTNNIIDISLNRKRGRITLSEVI